MEVTKLLKIDHDRFRRLIAEYKEIGDKSYDKKRQKSEILFAEIDVHSQAEEDVLYPRCEKVHSNEVQDLLKESLEEHQVVKRLLIELRAMSVEDEHFDAKLEVMAENLTHHAGEEEKELFPLLIEKISLEERSALGLELENRKDALVKGWTGVVAEWFQSLIPQKA